MMMMMWCDLGQLVVMVMRYWGKIFSVPQSSFEVITWSVFLAKSRQMRGESVQALWLVYDLSLSDDTVLTADTFWTDRVSTVDMENLENQSIADMIKRVSHFRRQRNNSESRRSAKIWGIKHPVKEINIFCISAGWAGDPGCGCWDQSGEVWEWGKSTSVKVNIKLVKEKDEEDLVKM